MPVEKQVVSLYTATKGYLDDIPVEDVRRFEREFLSFMDAEHADILKEIKEKKDLTDEIENRLKQAIESFKKGFAVSESK